MQKLTIKYLFGFKKRDKFAVKQKNRNHFQKTSTP